MSAALPAPHGERRFPGQHALGQRDHWDDATAAVVLARMGPPGELTFFTEAEAATVGALLDQLMGQDREPRVPLLNAVDARLAAGETDGWHYADLPEDGETWRRSAAGLDADTRARGGTGFAEAPAPLQEAVLTGVQGLPGEWHGMPAGHVWNLWMRYACTAFYAHPWAWDEIGFPGPAYPRGYANLGRDRREHFEVRDAHPGESA